MLFFKCLQQLRGVENRLSIDSHKTKFAKCIEDKTETDLSTCNVGMIHTLKQTYKVSNTTYIKLFIIHQHIHN
jgi:hypothetical protein